MPPAVTRESLLHHDELREAHGMSPIQAMPQKAPRAGIGPIVGAGIIVVLLGFGGLYFWGASLNARAEQETLPLIPGEPVNY